MDMREASAMTEASGLVDGLDQASGAKPSASADGGKARPSRSPSSDVATVWGNRLRQVTVKAPLQSLFVAFLLGVWVARRR